MSARLGLGPQRVGDAVDAFNRPLSKWWAQPAMSAISLAYSQRVALARRLRARVLSVLGEGGGAEYLVRYVNLSSVLERSLARDRGTHFRARATTNGSRGPQKGWCVRACVSTRV